MFSRDVKHCRPTPRTINQAFGPYAEIQIGRRRERKAWLYAIGYGFAIGLTWYVITAIKAGAR
ncbi:hypothetical protein [Paraburkholderia sp. HD33-4]|uniref:hypothetical protein n=1 Tax=Paraburkholderia sp. HD33-4 TaxID=2883242 RepID=UPI001F343D68|nr:hypothetical protein [Paraburkholderia sp. HD33-4]